ncbi:MFS transporter [Lacticaseibacillus nasuensis]|uniref:Major facilitator superfamily protein n=1 Tax=Lacticaseibacillus nasuensis JCM 17158 TaxID=1291734 RepID=A0A0R1JI75_9LACO|nr:MFS transporter [Lacticaseibacillus nasuensis]KRK71005.1 major facilitator superfamily protein [Lacticaseibacillus nasuensis JCM 17158]
MNKHAIFIVTFALVLSNAMSGLDNTIVNTALPAIIADLHGLELMGWIVAIFLLGTAVSTPLWSKLGERIGNKRAYQLSALAFVLGSLLQGLAPNMLTLIIARAVAGIGNGGMVSLPYIIYAQLYENPRRRLQILGFVSASYATATIIGPLVGGAIVDAWSWHWVFYLNVPIGIISAVLVQLDFKERPVAPRHAPVDHLGAWLLTIGLTALLAAIELIGTPQVGLLAGLAVVAVVCLAALTQVERRAADPVIPGRLFANSALVLDFALFTVIWGAFMAYIVYAPMWVQAMLGVSALIGGCTQIPGSVTNFLGSGSAAPLRRHLSPYQVVLVGIVTLTITFLIMVLVSAHAPFWLIMVAGAFQGYGNGLCFSELQVKVQTDAAPADVPVATSFSFLIRMLSQTLTTAVYGLVMNAALRAGIAHSPHITMKMMNNLSNAASNRFLPVRLLPRMRAIMFTGLHRIMLVGLGLMLVAVVLGLVALRSERRQAALQ